MPGGNDTSEDDTCFPFGGTEQLQVELYTPNNTNWESAVCQTAQYYHSYLTLCQRKSSTNILIADMI